ncbi:MAG: hypothetical protein L6R36_002479 [Xanthoria steineri]|nr:MAG: hypothetical protein L6R36_002479 [Xanthoria steineri]
MPPTHPTVLELRQHHPVLPHHLQLEHDLRTLAIEGWFARHSHTDGFEHAWDLNITNNLQAQEEVKEASLHTERRSQWYQSTNAGTGIGNAHVENSKVVKPDLGSSHLPHLHLGQGQHVVDGVANYGVWGGGGGADILLQGTSNNNDHNNNDNAGDGGDESHSYGLKQGVRHDLMLNDVPATMAGWEAEAGGEDFDPGPWEEIGRQWARIRPWELH